MPSPKIFPSFEVWPNILINIDCYPTQEMKDSTQEIHLGEKLFIHRVWIKNSHLTLS
jgi:hypothetical protein